eukprot:TRINITY_DN1313_c0_g1_i1.p1 TRINITY_DN1313_c0_g1~~TRINITY_DN1313_c0_g1_i1.p1  ORF type:complete len:346 (-),score=107.98 TRINITY_DN1313_c0_g1_i1:17-946(-)
MVSACIKALKEEGDYSEVTKKLGAMKQLLSDEPESAGDLLSEAIKQDMFKPLLEDMANLEFEAKKDLSHIFGAMLRIQGSTSSSEKHPFVTYIQSKKILDLLLDSYFDQEVSLTCGIMLRECIGHEELAEEILNADNGVVLEKLFDLVETPNFDVASDAFTTLKDLLTKNKDLCAEFLLENFDRVFSLYRQLLESGNYVTRRQSLKLLGELLLDRKNFDIMTKYIADPENLKQMMIILRDKYKSIQYEAFHVFKVFVANPNKSDEVLHILYKNKDKLISFLEDFHNDNEEQVFKEEKQLLLKEIANLEE